MNIWFILTLFWFAQWCLSVGAFLLMWARMREWRANADSWEKTAFNVYQKAQYLEQFAPTPFLQEDNP